jgi:hypothetical protein
VNHYHQEIIVTAGEGINDAMPRVIGPANRWRLFAYWLVQGSMPQVIHCTPEEPLRCENRVVYKTTKKQTRPRTQVCGAELAYNCTVLRGPTEVDGVPTFFMVEVHSCPDCAKRRQADPGFPGQVSHRILIADMVKNSSNLSGVFEDILLEEIVPGRPVAFPFSEEHARRIKTQFEALITLARALVGALYAPVPEPLYRVPEYARRDRRDSGRERRAQSVAYAQAFTAGRPGAPLTRGWYSRLLQFFADVNGDTAAVPR